MLWPIHLTALDPIICLIHMRWLIEPSAVVDHRDEDDKVSNLHRRHSIQLLCNRHCSTRTRRWTMSQQHSQEKVKWNFQFRIDFFHVKVRYFRCESSKRVKIVVGCCSCPVRNCAQRSQKITFNTELNTGVHNVELARVFRWASQLFTSSRPEPESFTLAT